MANGLVAKGCYQFLAVGATIFGSTLAPIAAAGSASCRDRRRRRALTWLKPGVSREGFPLVMKEGRYAPDGCVWERTIYLHALIVAVGRPAVRLDEPICGTCLLGEEPTTSARTSTASD